MCTVISICKFKRLKKRRELMRFLFEPHILLGFCMLILGLYGSGKLFLSLM
jgi:hypothetical protein